MISGPGTASYLIGGSHFVAKTERHASDDSLACPPGKSVAKVQCRWPALWSRVARRLRLGGLPANTNIRVRAAPQVRPCAGRAGSGTGSCSNADADARRAHVCSARSGVYADSRSRNARGWPKSRRPSANADARRSHGCARSHAGPRPIIAACSIRHAVVSSAGAVAVVSRSAAERPNGLHLRDLQNRGGEHNKYQHVTLPISSHHTPPWDGLRRPAVWETLR